jgi:hypothetical protein
MQKSRGFEGELIIEIPKVAIAKCKTMPLIHSLYISRMGFYPKALHHYYQRAAGISETILIYCTNGNGWIQLQKEKVKIQPGEIFIIPKHTIHSYAADKQNPWTIYWFHFAGINADDAANAIMNKGNNGVQVGFSAERNELFNQIATTFLRGYSASNLLIANLTLPYYLATFTSPEHFQKNEVIAPIISPSDRAIKFMQQNLTKTLTLDTIAQSAHLSVSFFFEEIQTRYGLCTD